MSFLLKNGQAKEIKSVSLEYATFFPYIFTTLAEKTESLSIDNIDQLLEMIRGDLTKLLNTRKQPLSENRDDFLAESVLNYGTPDLSIYDPTDQDDREKVRKIIQKTIEQFEPRLTNICVVSQNLNSNREFLRMHFKIQADLVLVNPYVYVEFNSLFDSAAEQIMLLKMKKV